MARAATTTRGALVLLCLLALSATARACRGPPGFWEARLCGPDAPPTPPGDACLVLSSFLRTTNDTGADDVLRAPRDGDNAWLLLARQAIAAFANRLHEQFYTYPRGDAIESTVRRVARWLVSYADGKRAVPFVARDSADGALFVAYARALARYNGLASDKYDLAPDSCELGNRTLGEDTWDADTLALDGEDALLTRYFVAVLCLGAVSAVAVGALAYLYFSGSIVRGSARRLGFQTPDEGEDGGGRGLFLDP